MLEIVAQQMQIQKQNSLPLHYEWFDFAIDFGNGSFEIESYGEYYHFFH